MPAVARVRRNQFQRPEGQLVPGEIARNFERLRALGRAAMFFDPA
jgi:hypothetical protein